MTDAMTSRTVTPDQLKSDGSPSLAVGVAVIVFEKKRLMTVQGQSECTYVHDGGNP